MKKMLCILLVSATFFGLFSCHKYPNDPISFDSFTKPENRIIGNYNFENYYINGHDSINSQGFGAATRSKVQFYTAGSKGNYNIQVEFGTISNDYGGRVSFSNDKKWLYLNSVKPNSPPSYQLPANDVNIFIEESTCWKIKKLTKGKLWLITTIGGITYELHFSTT